MTRITGWAEHGHFAKLFAMSFGWRQGQRERIPTSGCAFLGMTGRQSGKSAFSLKSAILLHFTGKRPMPVDPTPHEQNTFVKPAELAHMGKRSCAAAVSAGRPPVPQRPHGNSCNSGMLRMFHKSRKFAIRWMCHRMAEHPWRPSEMTGYTPGRWVMRRHFVSNVIARM